MWISSKSGSYLFIFSIFLLFAAFVGCKEKKTISDASNQEVSSSDIKVNDTTGQKSTDAPMVSDANKNEAQKLKEMEAQTQEAIKEKEQEIETTVKKEVEQAIEEKETIEKEVSLKEQAVVIARQEAEALKKEAELTNDSGAVKKARQRTAEAEQLAKEAEVGKVKLETAKDKAQLAQEKITAQQAETERLKKLVSDLKRERAAKRSFLEKALEAVATIFIGIVLFFLLKFGLKKFEGLFAKKDAIREDEIVLRMKTISKLFHWLGTIIILLIVVYMVLETFGFNVAPLLAGAGIIGLAFGFGGQYLIRDLINGLFILIEGQYRINDVVKIGEYGGLVEDINLRITTLRDLEGRVIIIPNGEVKTVVNYTKEYAQALFDIGVAYKENVDQVMDVIKQVGQEMRKDSYFSKLILGDLEMFGVDDFGDSQVTIKFRIKTLPIKQWEVSREFKRRLKNRFDELGIEIPFPHRTLYWGAGEDNNWLRQFAQRSVSNK
jgi:small-conductance mechanosensitive channel